MIKNHFLSFINWYIDNREGVKANYIAKFYKNDNEKFTNAISEYVIEFSISSSFNPFLVELGKEKELVRKIESFLKDETTNFFKFSKSKGNHRPRALFGKENYLNYLNEISSNDEVVRNNIEDVFYDKTNNVEEIEDVFLIKKYNFNTLYNKYKFRLITQDRFYKSLIYPISLLKRIFQQFDNTDFFDEWLYEHITKIKFHTKTRTLNFSEITSLEINSNNVVNVYDKEGNFYELVDKRDDGKIVELRIEELKDLAIDHIEPFKDFYIRNKEKFLILKSIDRVILKLNKENRVKKRGQEFNNVKNIFFEEYILTSKEVRLLKDELNFINDNIELQMMSQKENLNKKRR